MSTVQIQFPNAAQRPAPGPETRVLRCLIERCIPYDIKITNSSIENSKDTSSRPSPTGAKSFSTHLKNAMDTRNITHWIDQAQPILIAVGLKGLRAIVGYFGVETTSFVTLGGAGFPVATRPVKVYPV
jgi:hypothetical protein